jgi:hypothetical protein
MHPGKMFIVSGVLLIAIGLLYLYGGKLTFLGKLPGDLRIERENFRLYFPLGTSLLVSILASLLFWFFRR